MQDFLRSLPVFTGAIREFNIDAVPDDPVDLFIRWLHEAVDDGVVEPHTMTLSTIDELGNPDARTLILNDLNKDGWWFATNSTSTKGIQLARRPAAALTFYWPAAARQVRVRGSITMGSAELSAADFHARGLDAKAVALASHESQPLSDRSICVQAVTDTNRRLVAQPNLVSPNWQVYAVVAHTVEFWQADKDRLHIRMQYRRHQDTWTDHWTHTLLWP